MQINERAPLFYPVINPYEEADDLGLLSCRIKKKKVPIQPVYTALIYITRWTIISTALFLLKIN